MENQVMKLQKELERIKEAERQRQAELNKGDEDKIINRIKK